MIKATDKRIVVQCDIEGKNSHRFENGTIIKYVRQVNNLHRMQTEPVNCIVIDGEGIKPAAEIIVHPNALIPTNTLFNYRGLSGTEIASNIRYFSIPEEQAFAWHDGGRWLPLRNFEFGLRIFTPYKGILQGVEPTKIKECLYVTTGEMAGSVVHTLKAADYQLVFQDINGREGNLIRFRHSSDPDFDRPEVTCINHELTKKVISGNIWVGLTKSDAKPLNEKEVA